MLYNQITVREKDSDAKEWKDNIEQLRAKIDVLDENLIYTLGSRMKVSRQIGEYKKNNNVAIVQAVRWDALLDKVVEIGYEHGLSKKFLTDVFNAIHEASVEAQNEIISDKSSER
jgi:chorismate mutase